MKSSPPPSLPRKPCLSRVYSALWHLWLTLDSAIVLIWSSRKCLELESRSNICIAAASGGWKKWRIFGVIQKFCVSQIQEQISAVFSFPTSLTFWVVFFYLPPNPPTSSSNLTLLSPSEGDSQAALRRKSTQTCLHFCEWKICVVKSCRPSFQRAAWGCTDGPERSGRKDWYKNIRLIHTRKINNRPDNPSSLFSFLWQNN